MTSTNTTATNVIVCAPNLKVDGSDKVSPRGRQERRVVWALLSHLAANGWKPVDVEEGYDEATKVASPLEAMELIFNLDDAHVTFQNEAGATHTVYLVRGNSPEEVVSDWTFSSKKGTDNFGSVMDSFDAEAVL
jgi:hypothetical protein